MAEQCRFTNCAHGNEPGCAVRAAMAEGALTEERFARWRKLEAEEKPKTVYPKTTGRRR